MPLTLHFPNLGARLPPEAFGSSATFLEVRPRVQDNITTTTAIALALEAISGASDSATVCVGIQILSKAAAGESSAASQAVSFVQQKKAKHAGLPAAFWEEFAHLCMFALPASSPAQLALAPPAPVAAPASSAEMSPPAKPMGAGSGKRAAFTEATTLSPASVRQSPVKSEDDATSAAATPSSKGGALSRRRRGA